MRALIQRVSSAAVVIDKKVHSKIGPGLLVFLGVGGGDGSVEVEALSKKIAALRIFEDDQGKMNLSLEQTGGEMMIVSQFTLHASTRKGNRPSFTGAAPPEIAIPLYEDFVHRMERVFPGRVKTGVFAADMKVSLTNDGPVTIWIDTDEWM